MHISIFRTLYKNVTDNKRIERLLTRNNIAFEKTENDRGSRYKIVSDTEEAIDNFKKNLRIIYPQISF
jgi:hypothetical protein